jgi:hypothetical protein
MRYILRSLALVAVAAGAVGCGNADVAGSYTIALTNRENACGFSGWQVGQMTNNVTLNITQNGGTVSGEVTGLAAGYLDLVIGGHIFTGTVGGNSIEMKLTGTRTAAQGNCDYTVDLVVKGTLTGDSLQGELRYTPKTDGASDCGALNTCTNIQAFSGSRPPK